MIEIHIILHLLEGVGEEIRKSLRKRKEMDIQQNDTLNKEIDTKGLLDSRKVGDNDTTIAELLEKNNILRREVKGLKRKQETQSVRLCEVTEKKRKVEKEKIMAKEDKRQMETKL